MKKKFFKTFFISFLVFACIYGGVVHFFVKTEAESDTDTEETFFDKIAEEKNDDLTFLLLGIDTKDLSKNTKERSDTMMLCKIDRSTGGISILSIPRDTRAYIRGRKNEEKINHAHAYGGPELSIKAVKDLLGIDLDYYVRVDYKIVKEYVNLIGGVEVDVPMDMNYEDLVADPPLRIHLKEGRQVLDGDKAMQFLRFRKGYKEQDIGRIKAQQQFIKATMKQTLKPGNIVKIPKIISTYYKYVDTNIPLDQIMIYATKAKDFSSENMEMATIPGEPKNIKGISYYIPYKEETEEIVKNMFLEHRTVDNEKIDSQNNDGESKN
ncbi:LCP family protein [Anaerosalibacter sp. Marseille-P3206]|uniref:LCP family protein n=1 Tax=Anaerosalibacter sp. Marseille-P3206 TaxID=1871005 RepID=UPI000984638D|nr:LCP family protein [Anaerosalibacter sp. Marseille-P3206]